jgi:hypothetical protein
MTIAIPRPGPIFADTNEKTGERWYVLPDGTRLISATTALKSVNKEALVFWAAKVVAEEAMEQLPRLVKAARRTPCGQAGENRCGTCRDCATVDLKGRPAATRDEAAGLGSEVHKVGEHYALTGEVLPHSEDAKPFIRQFLAWHKQFKPSYDASEMTVFDREHGWAGTLDAVLRLGWCPPKYKRLVGQPLVADYKTGKGVYAEAAMQLAAYRHAPSVLMPDGTELPMPETVGGLVVHLRPDGYQCHFVEAGMADFGGFLSALGMSKWLAGRGKDAIGRAMYKPVEPSTPTATKPPVKPAAQGVKATTTGPRTSAQQAVDPFAVHRNTRTPGDVVADESIPF